MVRDIRFGFEDKTYLVGFAAYNNDGPIVLPDNRVLDVHGWLERSPPIPMELTERTGTFGSSPVETVALVGGVLARYDNTN